MRHDPTEEEIQEATARIRASWTPTQQAQRLVGSSYTKIGVDLVNASDLIPSISEELGKEVSGWDYLTDVEVRANRKERAFLVTPVEVQEEDEYVEFEAVTVQFGSVISKGA